MTLSHLKNFLITTCLDSISKEIWHQSEISKGFKRGLHVGNKSKWKNHTLNVDEGRRTDGGRTEGGKEL